MAGEMGLATGKIYILNLTPDECWTQSGIWCEDKYFITCAHFVQHIPSSDNHQMRLDELKNIGPARAYAGNREKSFEFKGMRSKQLSCTHSLITIV